MRTTTAVPNSILDMIQRPIPGDKIKPIVLGEITLVSPVNTPIKLQLVQGDLVKENTDAIVNPTDQFAQLDNGVGAQIVYFGGQMIQDEVSEHIRAVTQIPTGNVCVTGAGNLRTKHIIHATGPNFYCPSQKGLNLNNLLRFTAMNIFHKAVELNCSSLSIPAISCGEFGFPKKECARTLFQALKDF